VSICPFGQRATESIRGNGMDAYPVKRAFTHFSAQRIIARKQYSWTRKICEMQVAGSGIESPESRNIYIYIYIDDIYIYY